MMPAEALAVGTLIDGMLDPASEDYLQGDLYNIDGDGNTLFPPYNYIDLQNCAACEAVINEDGTTSTTDFEYVEVMQPNNVYVFSCNDPMDVLILPDPLLQPVLQDVAVISECRINGQSNSVLEGVTLASSAIGGGSKGYEKAVIKFPSGVTFGADDNCMPGGNVGLYAAATVQIAAGASIDGLRIVAGGDVQLNANETADDLNIIAGHNIYFTANADIGTGCVGDAEGPLVYRYRLVH